MGISWPVHWHDVSHDSSHGHGTPLAEVAGDADGRSASCGGLLLAIGVRLGVEGLIRPHVADNARALVRETSESQCLAHFEDVVAVDLVSEQWISRRIRRLTVRRREGLEKAAFQLSVR